MGKKTHLPDLTEKKYDSRSKWDWEAIRNDYIYGMQDNSGTVIFPKPKDLELKYNVPANLVSNRVSNEKWLEHRKAIQREEAIAQQKEHEKRLAKKAVKFDAQAANDAMNTEQILGSRIAQIGKLQAYDNERLDTILEDLLEGRRRVDKTLRDELKPLTSSYELESIMKAYTLAQDVGRKAMGITDDKPGIINNIETIQIQPSQVLQQGDDLRNQKILEALRNSNMRIPGITEKLEQLTADVEEDDTIDAEVIEDSSKEGGDSND